MNVEVRNSNFYEETASFYNNHMLKSAAIADLYKQAQKADAESSDGEESWKNRDEVITALKDINCNLAKIFVLSGWISPRDILCRYVAFLDMEDHCQKIDALLNRSKIVKY